MGSGPFAWLRWLPACPSALFACVCPLQAGAPAWPTICLLLCSFAPALPLWQVAAAQAAQRTAEAAVAQARSREASLRMDLEAASAAMQAVEAEAAAAAAVAAEERARREAADARAVAVETQLDALRRWACAALSLCLQTGHWTGIQGEPRVGGSKPRAR